MTINSFIYGGGIVDNTTLFQFSMMCKQMKEETSKRTNKQCNVVIMMLLVRREQIDSRLVESGLQYGITEKRQEFIQVYSRYRERHVDE